MKVYNIKNEENDDELQKSNTNFKKGDDLDYEIIEGKEEFPKSIGRYNEASLVKKLEDYGIGRPSTYASTISKIQERRYVEKVDIDGVEKTINICTLKKNKEMKWTNSKTILGKEKQKLVEATA